MNNPETSSAADGLSERVILLTGAMGLVGQATARLAQKRGAALLLTDTLPKNHDSVETCLRELTSATYVQADCTDQEQVQTVLATCRQVYGRLDGAANIAGVVGAALPTDQYPRHVWDQVIAVNLTGTFLFLQAEISAIKESSTNGSIVNVSSAAGHNGEALRAAYVASKAGIIGLTKAAAIDHGRDGVRINTVTPGRLETPMFHRDFGPPGAARYQAALDLMPIGRFGDPRDVAEAITWLLSDASSFVHGSSLLVDGGFSAH